MTDIASAPAPPQSQPQGIRVLLADDAADIRSLVRMSLEIEGFDVVAEAENGAEAVALAEAHDPQVVVLDVAMPVMDGVQALGELRRRCPDVPVVMFSGFEEGELARHCVASGAAGYVEKGGDIAPLVRMLRQAVLTDPPATVAAAPAAAPIDASAADAAADPRERSRPTRAAGLLLVPAAAALPIAVAAFVLVFLARLLYQPDDSSSGLTILYVVPVSLLAARYGLRGGLIAASVAVAGVVGWLALTDATLSLSGLLVRALAFYLMGFVVGRYADRVEQLLTSAAAAGAAIVVANRELARTLEDSRRKNRELEAANADLRQFGYIVSHDLAEPLRTMSGFATLLESDYQAQLGERGVQYLGFIRGGATRMQSLIDDLRAYTRAGQQDLTLGPVALDDVVDGVVGSLGATLAERHAVVTRDPLPVVSGDSSLLSLVFQNLLSNGVKFNTSDAPVVHVSAHADPGGAWTIDVVDNGIGIPADFRDRIFGLFTRLHTRDEYPGTGLGLAISRRILQRHGATVEVVPTDSGSRFRLTFPAPTEERP